MLPILVQSVSIICGKNLFMARDYYIGNVRYHRKNPIVLMFLPNNHAGNKLRKAECLVLRHPVMLTE
jgi:hypothetical protein